MAISGIIYSEYLRYEHLTGTYIEGRGMNLNSLICPNFLIPTNFNLFLIAIKGDHFWMAAALLICASAFVFLIATLCSCGAIKENSHIILTVSNSIA